jgi:hypothetical protein
MLITFGELVTFETVPPNLLRELGLVDVGKAVFLEKLGVIGKGENTLNTQVLCLLQTSLYQ